MELTFRSRNYHGHVPIIFLEAIDARKHLGSPLPEESRDAGGETVDCHRPLAVPVSSDPNPALPDYFEEKFLSSLAFNP